jgi:ABC-type transport system involved in Fe-S cluster assembly fused permease/ATPase subunit
MDESYSIQLILVILFVAIMYFRSRPSKSEKIADAKYKESMKRYEACKVFGTPEYFEAMRQVKEDFGIDFKAIAKALASKSGSPNV